MQPFTLIFLLAVAVSLGLDLWLARRHVTHIRANREAVPPEFAASLTLEAHQRAADYTIARTRFGMMTAVVDTVVLIAFTVGGGLDLIAGALANAMPGQYFPSEILLVGAFILISSLISLPFSWHRIFGIETDFGFNKMSPGLFIKDLVKSASIGMVLGVPLLLAILVFIQTTGQWWWVIAWASVCLFMLFVQMLAPTVIMPLFFKFSPLEDGPLKQTIQRLLEKSGFTAKGLFVMDGSTRSRHSNAFFSGFGAAKRIVLFDTLIEKLGAEEIEAVLAHELGHFKRKHIVKGMAMQFLIYFLFFALLGFLLKEPWFYQGLGVTHQSPAMALLLLLLALPVFTFVLHPMLSYSSRKREFEADAYAAEQTSASALIRALTRIYDDNAATVTPDPLHSAFHDSHPPAFIRIGRLKAAGAGNAAPAGAA
ncbi:MAG TPA: M48 family metallopeptidase [Burkholderiales bacterium]|jgi:STE24 endopeptidase